MTRESTPRSNRCVAKLCRSVWGVTRLARPLCCQASPTGGLHGAGGQMPERAPGREQPLAGRPQDAVIGAQQLQQAGREYRVAILTAFAVLDADQLAFAVDVGNFQGHGFGDAESGAIAGQQHGAVLDARDLLQEALDFVGGQDNGQFLIQAGTGKIVLRDGPKTRSQGKAQVLQFGFPLRLFDPTGRNCSTSIVVVVWTVWPQWTIGCHSVRVLPEGQCKGWTSNIMRTESFHADDLAKALRRCKIATMPELKRALGTEVDVTVFRKLKQLAYRTSYSHRGSYYTLDETAHFDRNGLWSFQSVWFSRQGTLLDTAQAFVENSSAGYFAEELDHALHVGTKEPLLRLVQHERVARESVKGLYLYCSINPVLRERQLLARHGLQAEPNLATSLASAEVVSDELKAAIVLFSSMLNEKQRRLYAGLESLKLGYGGRPLFPPKHGQNHIFRGVPGIVSRGSCRWNLMVHLTAESRVLGPQALRRTRGRRHE